MLPQCYDYAALAQQREREALLTLDPSRRYSLQIAARYARRRVAGATHQLLFPKVESRN
ncbi:hypothetical protein [Synechococcus sp. PCC 7335]|uniref:hypothetical protein n=1 Tax=Synechococcus sp. (strain ATCC 29403 / PCC 7335) TaxID=91464 RepID=UPI0012FBF7B6|nr:hypothetical protein [Synechococcus sp. PCC 7335]